MRKGKRGHKKGVRYKSYNPLFHASPFFALWSGLLHLLGQFAHIGGAAHVKGLRSAVLVCPLVAQKSKYTHAF